jgi:hypothetical protein
MRENDSSDRMWSAVAITKQTLVKVDLGTADERQAAAFQTEMESRGWRSVPEIPSAFCTTILGDSTDEEIVEATEEDTTWSAELAHIYDWDAFCIIE